MPRDHISANHAEMSHRLHEIGIDHSYSPRTGRFYISGTEFDPVAEIELAEWASSQPNDPEPEFAPVAHPADLNYPYLDFDELCRHRDEWRRMYDTEAYDRWVRGE